MDFISAPFLFYLLPILVALQLLLPQHKKYLLLAFSIIFYAWGGTWFLSIILITLGIDFWIATQMTNEEESSSKKYLFGSIALNLAPLLYYKLIIFNSLESNVWMQYGIPLGLSMIYLQRIKYVFEIEKDKSLHLDNPIDYATYHLFFPKIISGPFTKITEFKTQILENTQSTSRENLINGGLRFALGLAKKVLLVTALAQLTSQGFLAIDNLSSISSWIVLFTFSLQIFFELSAYSDMAIGLSLLFGYSMPENFNNPYSSGSITMFWRNWMISIHLWFKELLYPLVKNKPNSAILGGLLVFTFTGFLLGFKLTTLVFVLYSFLFLVLDKTILNSIWSKIGLIPSSILTFIIISFGWLLLRSENIDSVLKMLLNLVSSKGTLTLELNKKTIFYLILAIIFAFWNLIPKAKEYNHNTLLEGKKTAVIYSVSICVLFIFTIAYCSTTKIDSFTFLGF